MDPRKLEEAAEMVDLQGKQLGRIVAGNAEVIAEARRVVAAARAARERAARLVARLHEEWGCKDGRPPTRP